MLRFVVSALSVFLLMISSPVLAREPQARMLAFLEQHCEGCHDTDTREGGLDLASLDWQGAAVLASTREFAFSSVFRLVRCRQLLKRRRAMSRKQLLSPICESG